MGQQPNAAPIERTFLGQAEPCWELRSTGAFGDGGLKAGR